MSYPSPTLPLPVFFPAMAKTLECNCQVNWFMELTQKSWGWKAWFSSQAFSLEWLPKPLQVCQCLSEDDGRTTELRVPQGRVEPAGSAAFWKLSSVLAWLFTATKAGKEQKVVLSVAYVKIKEDSFLYTYFLNQYFKSFLKHKPEFNISRIRSIWTGIKIFLSKVSSLSYSTNTLAWFCFSVPSSLC